MIDKEILVVDDNRDSYPEEEDLSWIIPKYHCRLVFADPVDPITTGLARIQGDHAGQIGGVITDCFDESLQTGTPGRTLFWHVRKIRELRPDLRIAVHSGRLTEERIRVALSSGADICFHKGQSLVPLYELIAKRAGAEVEPVTRTPRGRLDVFANLTPDKKLALRGKVLVVGDRPERIIHIADSLADAERQLRESPAEKGPYRLVGGPPLEPISLAELEGR